MKNKIAIFTIFYIILSTVNIHADTNQKIIPYIFIDGKDSRYFAKEYLINYIKNTVDKKINKIEDFLLLSSEYHSFPWYKNGNPLHILSDTEVKKVAKIIPEFFTYENEENFKGIWKVFPQYLQSSKKITFSEFKNILKNKNINYNKTICSSLYIVASDTNYILIMTDNAFQEGSPTGTFSRGTDFLYHFKEIYELKRLVGDKWIINRNLFMYFWGT